MAKPYQNATAICTVLTIFAFIGAVIGLMIESPVVILVFLLPTVIYEVYRTEGESTKLSSFLLLGVFIAELLLIIFDVKFDLINYFGVEEKWIAGYEVPLGDVKVVGPTVMAVLSVVLFTRTYGKYTKWLAAVIFCASFAVIYALDSTLFERLVKFMIEEGLNRVI
jgi:hypothetical protein